MTDKKELKQQYRQYKPEMGVIAFKCLASGKTYLTASKNIKADINGITFQLELGNFPTNANLLKDWKACGQAGFEVAVVETLEYSKDESKTDYTDELKLLCQMHAEKLDNWELIKK